MMYKINKWGYGIEKGSEGFWLIRENGGGDPETTIGLFKFKKHAELLKKQLTKEAKELYDSHAP